MCCPHSGDIATDNHRVGDTHPSCGVLVRTDAKWLLKLAVSDTLRQKGVLGAQWLLGKQNADGSWSMDRVTPDGITSKPDLFLSLLAIEALVRSGIEDIGSSIDLGLEWVRKQQNPLGLWDDDYLPFPLITVLVLELIETRDCLPHRLSHYQSMSKNFLNRSMQLALEENSDSHRLAVIAAFHAIEAFLYSALTAPTINVKIFDRDETVGMKKALTLFQTHLQEKGRIPRNQVVPHRNSLDRLAYLRDQIVHKGIDVSQSECRPLIDDAAEFAGTYSVEVFGFNIFL
jgi:hypothetical protein